MGLINEKIYSRGKKSRDTAPLSNSVAKKVSKNKKRGIPDWSLRVIPESFSQIGQKKWLRVLMSLTQWL